MTVREVAEQLQLSSGAVYKAINNGTLKHHRFGSSIRISQEQLREYLEQTRSVEPDLRVSMQEFKHL